VISYFVTAGLWLLISTVIYVLYDIGLPKIVLLGFGGALACFAVAGSLIMLWP
jgi:hypothetical protein